MANRPRSEAKENTTARWRRRIERLLSVRTSDPEKQRRGQLVSFFLLCLLGINGVITIVNAIQWLVDPQAKWLLYITENLLGLLLLLGLWILNRRGLVPMAAWGLLILLVVGGTLAFPVHALDRILIVFAIPVLAASFIVRPRVSLFCAGLSILAYTLAYLLGERPGEYNYIAMLCLVAVAFFAWMAASRLRAWALKVRHLATFPELNRHPIVEIEPSGRVLYQNPATAEMLPGLEERGFAHPWLAGLEESFRRPHGQEAPKVEREVEAEGRWFFQSAFFIPSPGTVLVYGVDITDRRQRERQWRELSAALENTADAVAITDREGRITYVNPAFERQSGYSLSEAAEHTHRLLLGGEQDQLRYEQIWKTISKGRVWRSRMVNRRKDGSRYLQEISIAPIKNEHGEISGYVSAGRDVTSEAALEEQLRQSQKMEAVGQLAGGIAHDFNNMLQVIGGYVEMLQRKAGAPPEEGIRYIGEIARAAERAARLTSQLLAFSRRQILELRLVHLNDVIDGMLDMIRRVIGEDVDLRFVPGADLPPVQADASQIEQVLLNLCLNAREAMLQGGELVIETLAVEIGEEYLKTHPWAEPGTFIALHLSDTGRGMSAEVRERIFEPFFTTKPIGKGSGLGMSMVYGTLKQHRGMITVYSEPDQGTTIKVYLPAAHGEVEQVEEPDHGVTRDRGSETVLLAEDDELVRKLAEEVLEQAGYIVLSARDGEEALELFRANRDRIALAIMDVIMPKLGGKEVCRRIRELKPELPVLFASGYSNNAIHSRFVLQEGMELIQKPFNLKNLLRRVRLLLDRAEEQDEQAGERGR